MGCKCCSCPFGPFISIPIVLSIIGWILLWPAVIGCAVFKYDIEGGYYSYYYYQNNYNNDGQRGGVGYWGMDAFGACRPYNDDAIDSPMQFARAMGLIAFIGSFVSFIILTVASCAKYPKPFMLTMSGILVALAIAAFLSLVGKTSNLCDFGSTECKMAGGGYSIIMGGLLLIVASFWTALLISIRSNDDNNNRATVAQPVVPTAGAVTAASTTSAITVVASSLPEDNAAQQQGEGTKTTSVETTQNDDGTITKITTETQINDDGSKTVTQTKEVTQTTATADASIDMEKGTP